MLGLDKKELFNSVEALLFVAGDPVTIEKMSEILYIPINELESFLTKMIDEYNFDRRGIKMIKIDKSYQLITRPEYFDKVVRLVTHKHKQVLSPSTLEVLSIVSYNQPITKAAIEKVRGVDSSYSIAKLLERDLITQKGKLDVPGKPILYGTTDEFLRCFGLESLNEMPNLEPELENISFDGDEISDNVTFDELEKRITSTQTEEQTDVL